MLSLVFVALVALASANPVPAATPSPILCPIVTKLVTALKQQKPASAFCSSYLRIPIVTTTTTQTETRLDRFRGLMARLLIQGSQLGHCHINTFTHDHHD
jgi:hypothetical protein